MADEFKLRNICIYGAAGRGKGVIDVMPSFGVKHILRKYIVIHDVFFNRCIILNILLQRILSIITILFRWTAFLWHVRLMAILWRLWVAWKSTLWKCCNNSEDDVHLETFDEEINKIEQIFDFIIVLLFASLFSGSKIEPLYFLEIRGKGVAEEYI